MFINIETNISSEERDEDVVRSNNIIIGSLYSVA